MRYISRFSVVILLVTAACGAGPIESGSSPTQLLSGDAPVVVDSTLTPLDWWRSQRTAVEVSPDDIEAVGIVEFQHVPLDLLWHAAEYVVRADVVRLEGPFWNQASGQPWVREEGEPLPVPYREVTVKVTESFRGDLNAGDETVIFAHGASPGVGGGPFFEGASFEVGEDVVLVMMQWPFRMREGPIDVVGPIRAATGVLNAMTLEDGGLVFLSQWPVKSGHFLLDGQSIADRYPDGIPEGELAELTRAFDAVEEIPEFFEGIYFPYGRG